MVGERVDTSYFWLKRMHSLTGAFPLGAFVILQFVLNSFALSGPGTYDSVNGSIYRFPLTLFLEIVFVAIPLMLHVMMGLVILYRSSANVVSYSYYRNWMYFLQRVSGFIALLFVFFYVWTTRIAPMFSGGFATYAYMQRLLNSTWVEVFFIVGVVALVFHLANGMVAVLMTWGFTQTRRSQFAVTIASWILMMGMWFWGIRIIFSFKA